VPLYTAFGLGVRSTLPLPELTAGRGGVDVRIRPQRLDDAALRDAPEQRRVAPRETRFHWDDVGTFAIRDGREILIDPWPGVDERLVRIALLGPALAVLLQQRGNLVLHASAVSVHGAAVAFLGCSGSGKSTLAAALHRRGHALIADDLVAVRVEAGTAVVYPGFPQLKLWPDSIRALGGDPEVLPRVDPEFDKRARRATGVPQRALPLARAYVLTPGNLTRIEPLPSREAVIELVRHSYGVEWLHGLFDGTDLANRAEIARRVRLRRLTRPWDLVALSAAAVAVEADLAAPA
jgi:hypothetical protein